MTAPHTHLIPPDVQTLLNREFRLSVGGVLTPARSGATYENISPVTETVIAKVPNGGKEDVDAAVGAAEKARKGWARTTVTARAAMVNKLADLIEANGEELALLDAIDGGLPIHHSRNDVTLTVSQLRMFASFGLELKGTTIPASENIHLTLREPIGIVARIVPFNHPLMFTAKIAAPLVAGNCVILKVPETAPLSALRLGELAQDIFPPGVLSILVGNGPEVPRALVQHPKVRRIGFIGSKETGMLIQRDAASVGVKDISLELGGKNAMIVFPDADLDKAAAGAVSGMNFNWSGQSCGSNSRLLVHEDVAEELTNRVVELVNQLSIGNPLDEKNDQGPMISQNQYEKTLDYINIAVSEGAQILTGGSRPSGIEKGYYVSPTVINDVRREARIASEEVFGPILSIMTFTDEEDAVDLANDVEYGLTASVWTQDITRAHRVIRNVEAGFTWINGSARHFPNVPFGGYKNSGVGREESMEELMSYTELKAVNIML